MSLVDDLTILGFSPRIPLLREALRTIDPVLIRCARDREVTFKIMTPQQRFTDFDAKYRLSGTDDAACLGMFDPCANLILLRDVRGAIAAHEIFHLVDWQQGAKNAYRSTHDPTINKAFCRRRSDGLFVSAYSAVSVQEYTAEAARAVLGFSSSSTVSKRSDADRLRRIDPDVVSIIESMIDDLRVRYGLTPTPPPQMGTAAPAAGLMTVGVPA